MSSSLDADSFLVVTTQLSANMAGHLGWWSISLLLAICLQHVSCYLYQNPDAPPSIEEAMSKTPGEGDSWKMNEQGHMYQDGNDLVLSVEQYEKLHLGVQSREGGHIYSKPWKNGIIPYTIVTGDFNDAQMKWIKDAMHHWEAVSCVRFRPATHADRDHLKIRTGKGCWSNLGEMGGEQIVNLDPYCFWIGTIEHELGHSIGLIHEHQRPQRDAYIRVDYYGVQSNFISALKKYAKGSDDKLGLPYDYLSLMHYKKTAFSKDGHTQILYPIDPTKEDVIGQVILPSFIDAKLVNKIYKCEERCTSPNKPTCTGDCFLNAECQCVCPDDIPKEVCQDHDAKCPMWMQQGECRGNSFYMFTFCRKSCGLCKMDNSIPRLPCIDGDSRCERWANTQQCETNPGYMLRRCRKACGVCNETYIPSMNEPCLDKNSSCPQLAANGECVRDTSHMLSNCKKSCKFCPSEIGVDPSDKRGQCADFDGVCYYWADINMCGKFYTWMSRHCTKACNMCDAHATFPDNCFDQNKECRTWAMNGECENNPGYMLKSCNESCDSCHGLQKPQEQCLDYNFDCKYWADHYECWGNPNWMKRMCPHSCKECPGDPPLPAAPCMDFNKDCDYWHGKGECEKNPIWMSKYCRKACNKCTGNEPTLATTLPPDTTQTVTRGCTDDNENCAMWARTHQCELNPGYMNIHCSKYCDHSHCQTPPAVSCTDDNKNCAIWASTSQCELNPGYMNLHCRKYCDPNHCIGGIGSKVTTTPAATCVDENDQCKGWANYGECDKNPSYMTHHCKKSCNVC